MCVKKQFKLHGFTLPGIQKLQAIFGSTSIFHFTFSYSMTYRRYMHNNDFTSDFKTAMGCNKFLRKTLSMKSLSALSVLF